MIGTDNLVRISLIRWPASLVKGGRGPQVAVARAISVYVLRGGVRRSGMTRIGSISTNGDGLGPFFMPRR